MNNFNFDPNPPKDQEQEQQEAAAEQATEGNAEGQEVKAEGEGALVD